MSVKSCNCTFIQHTAGDGCAICNPEKAIYYAINESNDHPDRRMELMIMRRKISIIKNEYCRILEEIDIKIDELDCGLDDNTKINN